MILPPSPLFYHSLNPTLVSKLDGAKVENSNKMLLASIILALIIILVYVVIFFGGNISNLRDLLGFNMFKKVLKKIKKIIKRK